MTAQGRHERPRRIADIRTVERRTHQQRPVIAFQLDQSEVLSGHSDNKGFFLFIFFLIALFRFLPSSSVLSSL